MIRKKEKNNVFFIAFKSNDYAELYKNWTSVFGSENVLVLFYEELADQPGQFIKKVESFLDIEHGEYSEKDKPVNKGVQIDLPKDIEKALIKNNIDHIKKMKTFFDNEYVNQWYSKYTK